MITLFMRMLACFLFVITVCIAAMYLIEEVENQECDVIL